MSKASRAFEAPAWLAGLMCTLAVAAAGGLLNLQGGIAAPAAFLGIFFAIFAVLGAKLARSAVSALCGVVGSIAAFISLDAAANCTGANPPLVIAWGALVVIIAALTAAHALFLRGANVLLIPLGLFGALETLAFFVLPFGISLDQTSNPALALIVSLIAAVVIGALVGYASEFGMFVFALLIGLSMLGVDTTVGSCETGPNLWGVGAVACYLVPHLVTRAIIGRFRRSPAA